MEGRTTVYNKLTNDEKLAQVNPNNAQLSEDFLDYLSSIDRSPQTITQYKSDLRIFFVFVLDHLGNKDFTKITKREMVRFQSYCLNELQWSPKRMRRVKSAISSLSNFIENILSEEDEFAEYRSVVKKIESPVNEAVREKTVMTDEQMDLLLDTLVEKKEYDRAVAIAILCYSGMRKGELLQMKMSYFTPERLEFGCIYKTDKIRAKGRGVRGKQLNKFVMNKVDKYLDLWKEERDRLEINSDWVFVTRKNNQWERQVNIENWKYEFSEIIGAPFYFHCLRHKLCSELVANNIPSEIIREYFGWDSTEMIRWYNDNSSYNDFGKYFNSDGAIQQEETNITDIK